MYAYLCIVSCWIKWDFCFVLYYRMWHIKTYFFFLCFWFSTYRVFLLTLANLVLYIQALIFFNFLHYWTWGIIFSLILTFHKLLFLLAGCISARIPFFDYPIKLNSICFVLLDVTYISFPDFDLLPISICLLLVPTVLGLWLHRTGGCWVPPDDHFRRLRK